MIDSTTRLRENRFQLFDPIGLINDAYYANHAIGARLVATRPSDDGFAGGSSPLRFTVEAKGQGGGDSDDSSPKLWKTSPAGSPPPETRHHEQPMSPNSRTEAIARGRRELMEMIKDMPESLYELSLKDIVDHNSTTPLADDEAGEDKKLALMADPKEKRENKKKKAMSKKIARSRSVDNGGYLLKTSVFPISFGMRMRRRRKKSLISTGSLKAGASASAAVVAKSTDKEWWKTKPSESDISGGLSSSYSGTSSGSSSRSSSTTSNRQGRSSGFLPGCCSFRANK